MARAASNAEDASRLQTAAGHQLFQLIVLT